MEQRADPTPSFPARLGLWDAISIIVGIVIGATIYEMPPTIFSNVSGPGAALGVWALGGVLSLIGAFCYAELATAYPHSGGDYVYLTRAYGSWMGFLFGWAQLAVILTSSIGAMAFVFANYAAKFWGLEKDQMFALAALAVISLSLLNALGVVLGAKTQNVLTVVKMAGLAGILIAGLCWRQPNAWTIEKEMSGPGLGLAMIFVLYGYGGWNDAAFVAAEVRDRRDIARTLILGTTIIMVVYLAVNAAYIIGLGFEGVRKSEAVAADVLKPLGVFGQKAMCLLVMISALGAINGLVLTGSRVYAALGSEHRLFAWLGRWHPQLGTPLWSLLAQALISLAMIAVVATEKGHDALNRLLTVLGLSPILFGEFRSDFEKLVSGSAPVFWGFFLLTGFSLIILRFKDPQRERPFRLPLPLFPLLPLIFCGTCVYMLYSAIDYAKYLSLIGVVPLLLGVPLYFLSGKRITPDQGEKS